MRLQEFFDSTSRNAWVRHGKYSLYVRRGFHVVEGQILSCFDLANVTADEGHRGKGKFTPLLSLIMKLATRYQFQAVIVESVLNPRLADHLLARGLKQIAGSAPPSFYQMLGLTSIREENKAL